MILKGSQRGGAGQLTVHLLRADDNEHVEVHEIRGFVADDLSGALREAYAVSRGTRCKQFMFSLSLNPPQNESVPIEAFENALDRIEAKLGLEGQPRAIVFHEKEGRRHAHCVWSRIDVEAMKAVNLPHYKFRLRDVSRELYIEHGWKMPRGLVNSQERNPLNFTRAEWQQAKRAGQDPRALKAAFQDCWAISDSRTAFAQALAARGLYLAKGDRRGFVAVDYRGEVYAVAKWAGVRTREVKARLGDPGDLPSVAETKTRIAGLMTDVMNRHVKELDQEFAQAADALNGKRLALVQRHRRDRVQLKHNQEARRKAESLDRSARFRKGLKGLWDRLTGHHRQVREQNEREVTSAGKRDRAERQALIDRQLSERRRLQREIVAARLAHESEKSRMDEDVRHYMRLTADGATRPEDNASAEHQSERRGRRRKRKRERQFELEP